MDLPASTGNDTPFKIGDTLTIYEAAMVYASRHPYPYFFAVKNGSIEDHLEYLKLGVSDKPSRKRARAQKSWDIYCEIIKRVEQGIIKPVKVSYDQTRKIDPSRTLIQTSGLVELAAERAERPRYLRHLLDGTTIKLSLRNKHERRQRGPVPGKTGFRDQDRQLFAPMAELIKNGEARSPYGAALKLADKAAGPGSPANKAKRVSALYRKEHAEPNAETN